MSGLERRHVTHETYLRGKPKIVGAGSSLDNRVFSAIIGAELSGNEGKDAKGMRGDGREPCPRKGGAGEGAPTLVVREGRRCIFGNGGAAVRTVGIDDRGYRSGSRGRSIADALLSFTPLAMFANRQAQPTRLG